MSNYKVKFFDNHILVHIPSNNEEEVFGLIDTGAPATIGDKSNFEFCGKKFKVTTNYGGTTTAGLSELVGHKVHFLIGNDILCKYNLHLTTSNATFYALENTEALSAEHKVLLPIQRGAGKVPIISVSVNSVPQQFFFDTGAKLSYIQPIFTQALNVVGQVDDFHPTIGKFKTNVFDISLKLAENQEIVMPCGNLPDSITALVTLMPGVIVIIRLSIFANYNHIFITPSQMYLW